MYIREAIEFALSDESTGGYRTMQALRLLARQIEKSEQRVIEMEDKLLWAGNVCSAAEKRITELEHKLSEMTDDRDSWRSQNDDRIDNVLSLDRQLADAKQRISELEAERLELRQGFDGTAP